MSETVLEYQLSRQERAWILSGIRRKVLSAALPRKKRLVLGSIYLTGMALVLLVNWLFFPHPFSGPVFPAAVTAFLIGVATLLTVTNTAVRMESAKIEELNVRLAQPRTVVIAPNGLRLKTATEDALFLWNGVTSIDTSGQLIMVYIGNLLAIGIPRRLFADAAAAGDLIKDLKSCLPDAPGLHA